MEKKLISLAEENKIEELVKNVSSMDPQQVFKMIEKQFLRGKSSDTFPLVKAILLGSPPEGASSQDKRLEVYKLCIRTLQKNEMSNKMSSQLVGLLMLEADTLAGPHLAELTGQYVDDIKSGLALCERALELFPKLLSTIASLDNLVYAGNHRSGKDYKGHVLNTLCSCRWERHSVLHLASMFRDVPLTSEELTFVIEKVLRMFTELEIQDLPALVYQLLLLSTKGHKKLVLEGIIKFFTQMDNTHGSGDEQEFSEDLLSTSLSVEDLRQTEGTVILHISFAVKHNQDLGKEFVKYLKSNQLCSATKCLSPFSLALSLSLARIHRFEEQIYDLLKSIILKSFKDMERSRLSCWVSEVVEECTNLHDSVLQTVKHSKFGWDHVVQGLVQLGFLMMDSFGPKAVFGRVDIPPSIQTGPTQQACQLGMKILLHTFRAHEMVRSEILEQLFNRVVTKATTPVSHYLELLSDVVRAAPQMLLESSGKVREIFDYLSYLTPGSAEGLLNAVQPLLKFSMALKDSLIVVLRKAMFSKQLDSRKIGCRGFLMIMKHFKVLGGLASSQSSQSSSFLSQVQVDIHTPYNPSSNEALCLGILGNLRRCLTQQADVRLLLYEGLYEVLSRNTELRNTILEVLLSQVKGYYENSTETPPPLKLDPCILAQDDQVYLAEPLAHLLCCIQLCLVKCSEVQRKLHNTEDDDGDEELGVQTELEDMMESLTQRMIQCEMEDFELDKSADYNLSTSVGVRNNIFAILMMGTYEVLMEYIFITGNIGENSVERLIQLFEKYRSLCETLQEKSTTGGTKKKKASPSKTPNSLLSIKMVTMVLEALVSDSTPSHQTALQDLRINTEFFKYALNVSRQKLQQLQDRGHCDGAEGNDKQKAFSYCCTMGRQLLKYFSENQMSGEGRRAREKQMLSHCLEGLVTLVTIVTQRYPLQLIPYLSAIEDKDTDLKGEENIYQHIQHCQRLFMNIFSSDEDERNLKDGIALLSIIVTLSKALSANGKPIGKVLTWLQTFCTEENIDDLGLCKQLVSSLLSLTQRSQSSPILLRDLAQDIHTRLGDVDEEIELADRCHFALVTQRSAPNILQLVLQQCDKELDDTDWVIARVQAEMVSMAASTQKGEEDSDGLTQREGHEKSVCTRVGIIITALHELVQSAIPIGQGRDLIVTVLTRLYTTLAGLVKYYLMLYNQRLGSMSARFEKLVKLSGTHLTQYCYALISYIQMSESEKLQSTAPLKGKKKDDKKKKKAAPPTGIASIMKQTRTIPRLIYTIEQYERFLVQLSKKSKVNLMEHMKNSTSRDFRINGAILTETMANQSSSEEEDEEGEDADKTTQSDDQNEVSSDDESGEQENEENDAPPKKRAKKT